MIDITGTGNVVHEVTAVLARHHIIAEELSVEQPRLDDAYLALTEHVAVSEGVPAATSSGLR